MRSALGSVQRIVTETLADEDGESIERLAQIDRKRHAEHHWLMSGEMR